MWTPGSRPFHPTLPLAQMVLFGYEVDQGMDGCTSAQAVEGQCLWYNLCSSITLGYFRLEPPILWRGQDQMVISAIWDLWQSEGAPCV
jgi:hypothetical protein